MIADLFIKILNLSIGAVPIMAALLVLRLLFRKAVPRKVFYIAWALVFLRLMVPFSLESDLSIFNFVPKAAIVEENIGTSVIFIENSGTKVDFPVLNHPSVDNPNTDAPALAKPDTEPKKPSAPVVSVAKIDKNHIYGTVWIFGTAGLLLFGIIGYFAVLKKIKFESVPYSENIRLSDFFKTPIVCGLIRPKIILPMNFDLDDDAKVKSVIAHECTHIRRGDNFWRLLASFNLYVHWFNPLVWICYDAFIRDMEVSCDEEVLGKSKRDIRGEYAESLVSLSGKGTNPLYGGVLSFGESAIKERVKCIMNFKRATLLIVIICIAVAAALGAIFLTNPSVLDEPSEYYEIEMEKSEALVFDKEKGVDISAKIHNISDIPIYIYPEIELYFHDGNNWTFFGNYYPSEGTVVLNPGTEGVLCGTITPELFEAVPEIPGKYKIRRQISKDAGNSELVDYAEYCFEIKEAKTSAVSLDSARIGNLVTFGNYNGALEWLVIGEKDDQLLLITKDCIEALPYHNSRKKVTWPDSDIREWLNYDFIEYAFSGEEKMFISGAVLENPDNKRPGGAIGSNKTIDEVFLLSHDEVLEYFPNGINIYTEPTPSAEKNLTTYESGGSENWWWWTRSPGLGQDMATVVNGVTFGIGDDGLVVTEKCGVRPAMWVYKTREAAEEAQENAETNPGIGYDLYAAVYDGKVINGETVNGKYIPKASVLPKNVVWVNEEQKEYCEDLLDSIDLGFADAFLVGDSSDGNTRVGISMTQAENLFRIVKKLKLVVSEPTNPNIPAAKEIHIVMNSGDYIKIVWDTSYFTIYRKGDENAFRFDASKMKDSFTEFRNLANEYFIHGAGTLAQQTGGPDMEHLIPEREETVTTLFNNSDKFAVESEIGDELRDLLTYENFESVMNPEETEVSYLGNPLTIVDGVEFSRTEDGKKYTLTLYEKGFVLSGSASGKLNGAVVTVEEKTWEKFVDKINKEFENAPKYIPYWFGLVNQKNVLGITAKHEDFSRFYNSGNAYETDYLQEIIYRLRSFGVSSEGERFNGNQIPETNEKHLVLTIEFNTWTEYTVIFTRTEVIMVSSDMSYGLRYKTETDGYDCFLDFATEEGPINAITG